jgi:outer membrane protein assembly factor BamB
LGLGVSLQAGDWYQWRGPEQTGVSREKDLPEKWSAAKVGANNLIWRAPYGGRTTPIVMNGKVYLINNVGERLTEQERVLCLDAETGKLLWETKFNVFHTDIVSVRVGWTNLEGDPETGNVYAHGTQGLLLCLDGKDGKVKWSRSLTEEFGRATGYGGRVTSPIIDGDLLLISMVNSSWGEQGRGATRFAAFDKRTGEVVWWADTGFPNRNTYYSTPMVAVIEGRRLVIGGGGDGGVHAFQARTGKKVWSHLLSHDAINLTPVVDGPLVYMGHGDENLEGSERGQVVCLDASKVEDGKPAVKWKHEGVLFKFSSPVLHEGRLYISDDGATLYCYDAKKGDELWTQSFGTASKGAPVWADGKIYIPAVEGRFNILKPGDDGCEVLHRLTLRSKTPGVALEMNGSPAVANGRVYVLTSEDLFCLGKPGERPKADAVPKGPEEGKPGPDAKAAQLQVVPADVTLEPGKSVQLKARLFDADGRFLRETKAEWSLAGPLPPPPPPGQKPPAGDPPPPLRGEITEAGKLTAAADVPGQFGGVVAKAEGLTARARVRVAPVLPYAQDFEKVPPGRVPGGWVNAPGKFTVKEVDGNKVLAKVANVPAPPVAQANLYVTAPGTRDYTVQAEVMGKTVRGNAPDMGVIASRYTLQVLGTIQRLRLVSWDGTMRVSKAIPFAWKPGVWYVLKLSAETKDGKGLVRGKVWERGQKEPEEWSLTFEDPVPNAEGSAGLYGYATGVTDAQPGAEIYYDNLKVTPNGK